MAFALMACLKTGRLPQGFVSATSGAVGNVLCSHRGFVQGLHAAPLVVPIVSSPASLDAMPLTFLAGMALAYATSKRTRKARTTLSVALALLKEAEKEQDAKVPRQVRRKQQKAAKSAAKKARKAKLALDYRGFAPRDEVSLPANRLPPAPARRVKPPGIQVHVPSLSPVALLPPPRSQHVALLPRAVDPYV